MLVDQTNLYANIDKNNLAFKVDYDSICKFIGIILFSGYHHVPTIIDYWSQIEDQSVPFVANQMIRSRFKDVKKSSSSFCSLGWKRMYNITPHRVVSHGRRKILDFNSCVPGYEIRICQSVRAIRSGRGPKKK